MYEADPFLAHQEVKKRQAKATEKREDAARPATLSSSIVDVRKSASSNQFSQSPEVRMATSLRELVEDAIKEASYSLFTRNTSKDTKWCDLGTFP